MKFVSLFLFGFLLLSCDNEKGSDVVMEGSSPSESQDTLKDSFDELQRLIDESISYLKNRDLDGDGEPDGIYFDYSGGAHCCYKMHLILSSKKDTLDYPFEMDGGYEWGVDGSYPWKFLVEDFDEDGRDEIFMMISTYNAEVYPIDPGWKKTYGITQNKILFDFTDGEMKLSDYIPE